MADRHAALMAHIAGLRQSPIAIQTRAANEQHYEVPTRFYQLVLGRRLKIQAPACGRTTYTPSTKPRSACSPSPPREPRWPMAAHPRARLWLGLALPLDGGAFPPRGHHSRLEFAHTEQYIDAEALRRGLSNLTILTADMNVFDTAETFDRVVSVEMFEHMKNYQLLMGKIARWLAPGGRLFVHIFTHRDLAYHYEDRGPRRLDDALLLCRRPDARRLAAALFPG